MTFNILLFATIKEKLGKSNISLDLQEPAQLSDLLTELYQKYSQLIPYKKSVLVAVNKKFASTDQAIKPEDEIALFPPVSGG